MLDTEDGPVYENLDEEDVAMVEETPSGTGVMADHPGLFKIDEKKQEFISGDINGRRGRYLGTARSILLAENNHLKLIIAGEHTGAGNGTEDIGTGTLEQGFRALLLQDLSERIH
nr:BTB/POZ domain-containing protein POB1-like isoform X2 [Ipomoea batatas]GMC90690.1 BTB/POZ domain-containing protein POB1-like isoform X2 [Ipomoea batatas]